MLTGQIHRLKRHLTRVVLGLSWFRRLIERGSCPFGQTPASDRLPIPQLLRWNGSFGLECRAVKSDIEACTFSIPINRSDEAGGAAALDCELRHAAIRSGAGVWAPNSTDTLAEALILMETSRSAGMTQRNSRQTASATRHKTARSFAWIEMFSRSGPEPSLERMHSRCVIGRVERRTHHYADDVSVARSSPRLTSPQTKSTDSATGATAVRSFASSWITSRRYGKFLSAEQRCRIEGISTTDRRLALREGECSVWKWVNSKCSRLVLNRNSCYVGY